MRKDPVYSRPENTLKIWRRDHKEFGVWEKDMKDGDKKQKKPWQ